MALRFIDGFDNYTSTTNGAVKWTTMPSSNNSIQSTVARFNGNALKLTNTNAGCSKTIDQQASWVVGFAFQLSAISSQFVIMLFSDAGTTQCSLRVNTDGTLEVVRSTGTALDSSGKSSNSVVINTWYYIEWKVTISNSISAHSCKVNVNGTNWIDVNAAQSVRAGANNQANIIQLAGITNTGTTVYYDDVYICDGTGTINNDFLGDKKVKALFPTAAGSHTDFTPLSATNFSNVNETNPDGNTTYVETAGAGNIDTYTFGTITATDNSISGVQFNIWAERTDAGRTLAAFSRISSVDYAGTTTLTPSLTVYNDLLYIAETSPSSTTAWTVSEINGAEFGFKEVS